MTATRPLVFFGNTVFLAGIKAELKTLTHSELISIEPECPDAAEFIRRRNPAAVIFDRSIGYPDFAIALLRDQPGLLLIGMAPSSDEMLLWSGHSTRARNIQDLTQVIGSADDSMHQPSSRLFFTDQVKNRITLRLTRRQKLTVGMTLIGLGLVGLLGLAQLTSLTHPNAPLSGTAIAQGIDPAIGLAFGIGIVFGAVVIGLLLGLRVSRRGGGN